MWLGACNKGYHSTTDGPSDSFPFTNKAPWTIFLLLNFANCLHNTTYAYSALITILSGFFSFHSYWDIIGTQPCTNVRCIAQYMGFPGGSAGKESACNVGDLGWIPALGQYPEQGNGYPHQDSGLENSMDCIVHGVTKSHIKAMPRNAQTTAQLHSSHMLVK